MVSYVYFKLALSIDSLYILYYQLNFKNAFETTFKNKLLIICIELYFFDIMNKIQVSIFKNLKIIKIVIL